MYVGLLVFTPKSPVNLSPRELAVCRQITTEMATRGTLHPPGIPPCQATQACSAPGEQWRVWPQVPFLVGLNVHKHMDHCKQQIIVKGESASRNL